MLKYIILILMSVSCYLSYTPTSGLSDYVTQYEKLAGVKVTIPVTFVIPTKEWKDQHILGVCYTYNIPYMRYVEINSESWEILSDVERKCLILHELSHCVGNRDHTEDMYRGYPVSMMNPYLLSPTLYAKLMNEYDYELVTQDTSMVRAGIDRILKPRLNFVER